MAIERKIKYRWGGHSGVFIGTLDALWERFPDARINKVEYIYTDGKSSRWRDIPDYKGAYQISNNGLVKSVARIVAKGVSGWRSVPEKLIKPTHKGVTLRDKDGVGRRHRIKDLLKLTFGK